MPDRYYFGRSLDDRDAATVATSRKVIAESLELLRSAQPDTFLGRQRRKSHAKRKISNMGDIALRILPSGLADD